LFDAFAPVLSTNYFTLEAAPSSDGRGEPYYRFSGQDSVICCILDQNDHFVMVRQYRPNFERVTLETPAGGVEPDEAPISAARREIFEETGLRCPLLPLGQKFHLMMNRTNIQDYLFFGMLPTRVSGFIPEPGVEVTRVARAGLLQQTLEGKFEQLASLGLLQITGGLLQIDMWHSTLAEIEAAFRSHPDVNWDEYA
jgi:8-oxo-dGTP pyrophosphatase MutT (NUDIX family)